MTARPDGGPVPSYDAIPAVVDVPPATLARRCAAWLIDQAVLLVLGGWLLLRGWLHWADGVRAAAPGEPLPLPWSPALVVGGGAVGVVLLVQWVLHGRLGWSVGRLAVGIRTLDAEVRVPIGLARTLLRALVVAAGTLALGVGQLVVLLSPLLDRTGRLRGWHDLAARDEVLDVRRQPGADRAGAFASVAQTPWPPDGNDVPVEPAARTGAVAVPAWAGGSRAGTDELDAWLDEAHTSALVLAPIAQRRDSPDLDTRALPVVRAAAASALDPALELTRPVPPREDVLAEHPAPVRGAEIELTDGRRLTIERTALIGRNPASDAAVQLVRVVDPARSVSKTHLQIGVDPTGVWVADRGSTNGTVVTLPDGAQVVCRVDQQVRLRVGAMVAFGDCGLRLVRAPEASALS